VKLPPEYVDFVIAVATLRIAVAILRGKKKPLVERGLQFRTKENNIKDVGGLTALNSDWKVRKS